MWKKSISWNIHIIKISWINEFSRTFQNTRVKSITILFFHFFFFNFSVLLWTICTWFEESIRLIGYQWPRRKGMVIFSRVSIDVLAPNSSTFSGSHSISSQCAQAILINLYIYIPSVSILICINNVVGMQHVYIYTRYPYTWIVYICAHVKIIYKKYNDSYISVCRDARRHL